MADLQPLRGKAVPCIFSQNTDANDPPLREVASRDVHLDLDWASSILEYSRCEAHIRNHAIAGYCDWHIGTTGSQILLSWKMDTNLNREY